MHIPSVRRVRRNQVGMFRDCLVAENWYPLLQNPNTLDPRTLIGECAFAECAPAEVIAFQEGQPAKPRVLPRTDEARTFRRRRRKNKRTSVL